MKALIFNSGLGNRMGDFTKANHKSMTPLADGETILHRQLRFLHDEGIREFVITTGPFEEQIRYTASFFSSECHFTFVKNDIYDKTNYIYSMYLARDYINDDMLFLHGDLVFDRALLHEVLASNEPNLGMVNYKKPHPEKDFKGRVVDGRLLEVSIHIFDENCYTFQPLYKLNRATASAWLGKVCQFVIDGKVTCYAENAFNEISDALCVKAFDCSEHYIEEIDNEEDHQRVMKEIQAFDTQPSQG